MDKIAKVLLIYYMSFYAKGYVKTGPFKVMDYSWHVYNNRLMHASVVNKCPVLSGCIRDIYLAVGSQSRYCIQRFSSFQPFFPCGHGMANKSARVWNIIVHPRYHVNISFDRLDLIDSTISSCPMQRVEVTTCKPRGCYSSRRFVMCGKRHSKTFYITEYWTRITYYTLTQNREVPDKDVKFSYQFYKNSAVQKQQDVSWAGRKGTHNLPIKSMQIFYHLLRKVLMIRTLPHYTIGVHIKKRHLLPRSCAWIKAFEGPGTHGYKIPYRFQQYLSEGFISSILVVLKGRSECVRSVAISLIIDIFYNKAVLKEIKLLPNKRQASYKIDHESCSRKRLSICLFSIRTGGGYVNLTINELRLDTGDTSNDCQHGGLSIFENQDTFAASVFSTHTIFICKAVLVSSKLQEKLEYLIHNFVSSYEVMFLVFHYYGENSRNSVKFTVTKSPCKGFSVKCDITGMVPERYISVGDNRELDVNELKASNALRSIHSGAYTPYAETSHSSIETEAGRWTITFTHQEMWNVFSLIKCAVIQHFPQNTRKAIRRGCTFAWFREGNVKNLALETFTSAQAEKYTYCSQQDVRLDIILTRKDRSDSFNLHPSEGTWFRDITVQGFRRVLSPCMYTSVIALLPSWDMFLSRHEHHHDKLTVSLIEGVFNKPTILHHGKVTGKMSVKSSTVNNTYIFVQYKPAHITHGHYIKYFIYTSGCLVKVEFKLCFMVYFMLNLIYFSRPPWYDCFITTGIVHSRKSLLLKSHQSYHMQAMILSSFHILHWGKAKTPCVISLQMVPTFMSLLPHSSLYTTYNSTIVIINQNTDASWNEAKEYCTKHKASLPTIKVQDDNRIIEEVLFTSGKTSNCKIFSLMCLFFIEKQFHATTRQKKSSFPPLEQYPMGSTRHIRLWQNYDSYILPSTPFLDQLQKRMIMNQTNNETVEEIMTLYESTRLSDTDNCILAIWWPKTIGFKFATVSCDVKYPIQNIICVKPSTNQTMSKPISYMLKGIAKHVDRVSSPSNLENNVSTKINKSLIADTSYYKCPRNKIQFNVLCVSIVPLESYEDLVDINAVPLLPKVYKRIAQFIIKTFTLYNPVRFQLHRDNFRFPIDIDTTFTTMRPNILHLMHAIRSPTLRNCPGDLFKCSDGHCILNRFVGDGKSDCPDETDESKTIYQNIQKYNTSYNFQCGDMLIKWSSFCDSLCDCNDCEDETWCSVRETLQEKTDNTDMFICPSSGTAIASHMKDDLISDCPDGGDEPILTLLLAENAENDQGGSKSCYDRGMLPCVPGHPKCFPTEKLCIYDTNKNGELRFCRNGAHLHHCEHIECLQHHRCPDSYCIPLRHVCDDIVHCPDGDDERACARHENKCPGFFKCRNGACLAEESLCDGFPDCVGGEDEWNCPLVTVPNTCTSLWGVMICEPTISSSLYIDVYRHRSLHISIGGKDPPLEITNKHFLHNFEFKHSTLYAFTGGLFMDMRSLIRLDLSYNKKLVRIGDNVLRDLMLLREISLKGCVNLNYISENVFDNNDHINKIDLSETGIQIFQGSPNLFSSLRVLDLSSSCLRVISLAVFDNNATVIIDIRNLQDFDRFDNAHLLEQASMSFISDSSYICCILELIDNVSCIIDRKEPEEWCGSLITDHQYIITTSHSLFSVVVTSIITITRHRKQVKFSQFLAGVTLLTYLELILSIRTIIVINKYLMVTSIRNAMISYGVCIGMAFVEVYVTLGYIIFLPYTSSSLLFGVLSIHDSSRKGLLSKLILLKLINLVLSLLYFFFYITRPTVHITDACSVLWGQPTLSSSISSILLVVFFLLFITSIAISVVSYVKVYGRVLKLTALFKVGNKSTISGKARMAAIRNLLLRTVFVGYWWVALQCLGAFTWVLESGITVILAVTVSPMLLHLSSLGNLLRQIYQKIQGALS